ncbi:SAFB-like transcription modulator, partial [Tachysurus ichikawai]
VKDSHKDCKRDDSPKTDAKKDGREALKKAETGDKEKDSGKKGPSSAGAAGQAKSWVMGGIKRGDENTAVSRMSSTFIAFSSPYLWVKKSNSPRDDRGVYQSNEVIR